MLKKYKAGSQHSIKIRIFITSGPYPEPGYSSPQIHTLFLSEIFLSSYLRLNPTSTFFLEVLPPKLYAIFFPPMCSACPAYFITLDFIILL
jgi:hypothetical protein